jgi:hypothetical protein
MNKVRTMRIHRFDGKEVLQADGSLKRARTKGCFEHVRDRL